MARLSVIRKFGLGVAVAFCCLASAGTSAAQEASDLLAGEFWSRLKAINAVSDAVPAVQEDLLATLVVLLSDEDQSLRLAAAEEIGQLRIETAAALPALIADFSRPNGEEGQGYVEAVAGFGPLAMPLLCEALASGEGLTPVRAADTISMIQSRSPDVASCPD